MDKKGKEWMPPRPRGARQKWRSCVESVQEPRASAADLASATQHPGTRCFYTDVGFRPTEPKPKNSPLGLRR